MTKTTSISPIIGIPCSVVRDVVWWPSTQGVRESYLHAIVAAGGLPLLIPLLENEDMLHTYYTRLDGLLLAGGDDIAPVHYGAEPHEKLGMVDALRDHVEFALTRRALHDGIPILAICRGLQLLNVALGGTLYQDIPTHYQTTLDHRATYQHARATGEKSWALRGHSLRLEATSRLAQLLGTTDLPVNTLHHQAICDLAPGLRAVGWASDELIEAVEGTGEQFVVGVQCHPEALCSHDTRWQHVFRAFVAACGS